MLFEAIIMDTVGIIGAGVMGLTVAGKILEAGHSLVVYDVMSQSREKAQRLGAMVVDTPAEVAKLTNIILLFLPGPKEVTICVKAHDGLLSAAHPKMIIVDMSTVDPGTTQRMATLAQKKDIGYLDAPVLGRPVTVGQWALPVGGKKVDLERCMPIFELFAAKVFHIGDCGSGNKIKLLNQLMFGAINAMTAEMMAIAEKIGISPRLLYETITASQAGTVSNLFKELGKRIAEDNYGEPTFTVDLLVKDIRLAVQMAKESQAPLLLARVVEFINETAKVQGYGSWDTAVMWKCLYSLWEGKPDSPPEKRD